MIVPCFDQIEHTRRCVAALSRHTRSPWELIVVDNGSIDGTAEYLRGVRDVSGFRVEVVTNATNRGFPAACNQGLALARGESLVLLNNDVVVTDAWLNQLVALAGSRAAIGMAGPMTNYASPPQLVADASYPDLEAMHRFALAWRAGHRGRWFSAEKLSGFCLLIKRRAYEAVGSLDERFGLGFFDDDDLAVRMRRAGFDLVVAMDLFVHHAGSRTFVGSGVDATALLEENRARFEAMWGMSASPGRMVELLPWPGQEGGIPTQSVPIVVTPRPAVEVGLPEGFAVPELAPGTSREMVNQAMTILAGSGERPMAWKAGLWERLAGQVAEHGRRHGSSWGMERLRGADGSAIYLGRASEFLVFDAAGRVFRGKGVGCLAGSRGGRPVPHYPGMRPA